MNDCWLEINSPTHRTTAAVYAAASEHDAQSIHRFSEPWYEDGSVIRVLADQENLDKIAEAATAAGAEPHPWDATPDEQLYGDHWPQVRAFFEAASRLALARPQVQGVGLDWLDRKMIHCALNSWGYEVRDERDFARRVFKERKKMLRNIRRRKP